ncbi:DNA-binding protein smubp-2 [Culex quinquefasciatus]|uniref:DNA-binding protein smubp-2 n=1 Tax=Culex quinquefasciatus TaxID=7176 RepID=B0X7R4_CULQU|nr:DNA-binding protein smubp-2 [Culex quinquefasciatus]|eukprot:XP_001865686.1 DNA-binding protein smubp-2 [Culex quinquefasciatus]
MTLKEQNKAYLGSGQRKIHERVITTTRQDTRCKNLIKKWSHRESREITVIDKSHAQRKKHPKVDYDGLSGTFPFSTAVIWPARRRSLVMPDAKDPKQLRFYDVPEPFYYMFPLESIAAGKVEKRKNIIFSGDPKRLGPVIQWGFLDGISLLERLIDYDRNDKLTGCFDQIVGTSSNHVTAMTPGSAPPSREEAIMFISTERSGNVMRLNVSITRAQSLMIAVGDADMLERNDS